MDIIFPLMENKGPENQPYLEVASELLYSQLEASRSFLVKDYKKNIIDIFNGNVRVLYHYLCLQVNRISSSVLSRL